MDRIPITPQGLEVLKAELTRLKTVDRPENILAIEVARAHGDLSENAEYAAAKEKQSFIVGRIQELGHKIGHAEVIDPAKTCKDKALFGNTVVLENVDSGEEVRYQMVGPDESDINNGRISVTSPLGKALLGKKVDDEVSVQAPNGTRRYIIVEIE
ncbi:MAG: transcription elongation factor GreA [Deltaproteobacteria bacterium]|nr:transcription elongation factor GreA [Deltaproteobacteria bacterium]